MSRSFCSLTTYLIPAVLAVSALEARGQSQRAEANPACAVLSVAEVRKITGYPDYRVSPGDPPGQGAGGGASCQYVAPAFGVDAKGNPTIPKGPLISLVLIDGKDWTRSAKHPSGCKREPAPGIGDEAYFEVCPSPAKLRRSYPLYVKAGSRDLIVQMDIVEPDTEPSVRSKVVALAKAAVAKLR